jgi:hypothetical protein
MSIEIFASPHYINQTDDTSQIQSLKIKDGTIVVITDTSGNSRILMGPSQHPDLRELGLGAIHDIHYVEFAEQGNGLVETFMHDGMRGIVQDHLKCGEYIDVAKYASMRVFPMCAAILFNGPVFKPHDDMVVIVGPMDIPDMLEYSVGPRSFDSIKVISFNIPPAFAKWVPQKTRGNPQFKGETSHDASNDMDHADKMYKYRSTASGSNSILQKFNLNSNFQKPSIRQVDKPQPQQESQTPIPIVINPGVYSNMPIYDRRCANSKTGLRFMFLVMLIIVILMAIGLKKMYYDTEPTQGLRLRTIPTSVE